MVYLMESHLNFTVQNIQSYITTTRQLIESELETFLSEFSAHNLRPYLTYSLLSGGKRLRPILVLLSAQSVGGNPEDVLRLALSFELLHTATLVHDDIIDNDQLRRGDKALYIKWSLDKAILVGDALIALSVNLAADYGKKVMKVLSNVGLELCEGEHLDVSLPLKDATEREYFLKIKKKSASLFRAAAYCGALVAKGKPSEVEALANFGEYFGIAYQIYDDVKDVTSDNGHSRDLRNGNVTLPFIQLFKQGDATTRKLLLENFGNKEVTSSVSKEIENRIRKFGVLEYCKKKIEEQICKAQASLENVRESPFKSYLFHFADYYNLLEV